jgi:hypothetical protein
MYMDHRFAAVIRVIFTYNFFRAMLSMEIPTRRQRRISLIRIAL